MIIPVKGKPQPSSQDKFRQILPQPWKFFLIAVLVTGIFFRLVNLETKVFWFDETATVFKISGYTSEAWKNRLPSDRLISMEDLPKYYLPNPESNVVDTIKLLTQEDPKHAPLYFVLLRLWVDWLGNSVAVMRSLSVLISLLVFPCIYWLCQELFRKPLVGWIGMATIAVSPFYLLYAQEARMYSLQALTILLSSTFLIRAIRSNTKLNWILYIVALSLSFYTHTLSLFVSIAHGVYLIITYGFRHQKILLNYFYSTLVASILFFPWLFFIITNSEKVGDSMAWATEAIPLPSLIVYWMINLSRLFLDFNPSHSLNDLSSFNNPQSIIFLGFSIILTGYSLYFLCSHNSSKVWVFVITLIGIPALILVLPDLLSGGIRSFNSRYLIAVYLGISLAVANLLGTKIILPAPGWQQKFWQIITIALLGVGIISCGVISPAVTWWNKYYSAEVFPVAQIINQADRSLLLIENYWWSQGNLYSMSHFLNSQVQLQIVPEGKQIAKLPEEFRHIFLFNPSDALQEEVKNNQNYVIQSVYDRERFLLWRLER